MEFLNSVFQLILSMLTAFVSDNVLGSILWIFILVMSLLLFIKFIRSV